MKKTFSIVLLLILMPLSVFAATINVPGVQPTIQAGIGAAVDGDVVLLANGTYTGIGNYNVDFNGKSITLKSASGDPNNCIVDCQGLGRGFLVYTGETVTFEGLTVKNGDAGDDKNGGGIHAYESEIIVVNCIFDANSASRGGAVSSYPYYSSSSSSFTNCIFTSNSASRGGAVFSFSSSSFFTNCTFTSNSASDGGAVYSSFSSFSSCTFALNEATSQGGAIWCNIDLTSEDPTTLKNCILWGNTAPEGSEMYDEKNPLVITHSNIQGGRTGAGNINADPLFVDAVNDDFHLQLTSPCIDTGTADGAPADDLDGNYRPTGNGYDMGAYEYHGPIVIDSFTATPTTGKPSLTVNFTCTAHDDTNTITGYQWKFGDGNIDTTLTEANQHIYLIPGTFTATCTVANDNADQTTALTIIEVTNDKPVAAAGPDQIVPGKNVDLDGHDSKDPDGNIVSWTWTLNHLENSSYDRTATGEMPPTVANLEKGNYIVTLTVTDNYDSTQTDEMHLCVAGSSAIYTQTELDNAYSTGHAAGVAECPLRVDAEGNKFLDGPLIIENKGLLTIQ